MNKKIKLILSGIIFISLCSPFFSQNDSLEKENPSEKKFALVHNYGIAWNQITRIQKQTKCSNFVWRDDLIGAFYSIQTKKLPINFIAKISAFYPYHYEFNKFPQISKQIILYSFELDLGPIWTIPLKQITSVNISPVANIRYQLSDKYHHVDLGIGLLVGFEFPITKKITLLLNGNFIYSNGNLGSNSKIQPFDYVWNYGAQLGVRISKRSPNNFFYFKKKSS